MNANIKRGAELLDKVDPAWYMKVDPTNYICQAVVNVFLANSMNFSRMA